MKIHWFAALMLVVFQTAFAKQEIPQSYGMPTYEAFRMMRNDQQTAYIEDLRDMLQKLDEHGLTEPAEQARLQRFLDYFMGAAIPEAQAGVDCNTVQFEFRGDSFCVKNYPGGGAYGCAKQNWQPVVQACHPQFESWKASTAITEKQAPQFNSTFDQFHANDQKKAQAQEDLAAAGLKLMDKAKRNEWDKEADANKDKFNLNCIYAGFTVDKGKKCEPKSEFTSKDKTYSCKAESKANPASAATPNPASAGKTVVRPANLDPNATVLCNPVLFGLNDKGEPYCVSRKGGATKQCLEDAKKNPKSLEAARKLLIENKDEYIKLRNTLTKICVGSTKEEVENYLVKTMKKSRKGARDLGQTCEAYSQRFKDYDASGAQNTIQSPQGTR